MCGLVLEDGCGILLVDVAFPELSGGCHCEEVLIVVRWSRGSGREDIANVWVVG